MTVFGEITYVFYMPQDYDEMKKFEAENDLSIYRRAEDTIAVRYKYKVNATYPYKSKADRKTEPQYEMGMGTLKCDNCTAHSNALNAMAKCILQGLSQRTSHRQKV